MTNNEKAQIIGLVKSAFLLGLSLGKNAPDITDKDALDYLMEIPDIKKDYGQL